MAQRVGTGLFPRAVMERFPLLPLEEEGRLNDLPLRENSIERVFAYYRWTEILQNEPTPGGLVRFHTAHKLDEWSDIGSFGVLLFELLTCRVPFGGSTMRAAGRYASPDGGAL